MKVFSVVGLHHSGKTTVCEEVMKTLKTRGFSVSSIKDIHQENFSMDREGSNSNRHLKANKESVIARSLNETCMIWNKQLSLNEMLEHMHTDWVLVEGMKSAPLPKVLCAVDEQQIEEMIDDTVFAISGLISDKITEYKGIPVINAIKNTDQLFQLIIEKVFEVLPFHKNGLCGHCGLNCFELTAEILKGNKQRSDCAVKSAKQFNISFNNEEIKVNQFVEDLFNDVLSAFCKNLKGYKKGDEVKIIFKQDN